MVELDGLTVEVGIALLQDLQKFRHLTQIYPGKARIILADVPAVVDKIGKLDCLCLPVGLCQMPTVQLLAH